MRLPGTSDICVITLPCLSLPLSLSHLDTNVLVHILRGTVALPVPPWAVIVPVIPRGALPVHHLQGLEVPGQRGGGRWRERFRGWLEEGCVTSGTRDTKGGNGDINGKTLRWRRTTTFTAKWDSLDAPGDELVTNKPNQTNTEKCVCECTCVLFLLTTAWYLFWLWLLEPEVNVALGSCSSPISSLEKNSLSFWTLQIKQWREKQRNQVSNDEKLCWIMNQLIKRKKPTQINHLWRV